MKINRELMKGSTSILILSLLENDDMYGYQISQALKQKSEDVFDLKEGTLYPMLHGLENENAVCSYWLDADNGKRRKYYKITPSGKRLLAEKKSEWRLYSKSVNAVIGGGETFCTPSSMKQEIVVHCFFRQQQSPTQIGGVHFV